MKTRTFSISILCAILAIQAFPYVTSLQAASVEVRYNQARRAYQRLLATLPEIPDQRPWLKCIRTLNNILNDDRKNQVADRCLYLIGQSYHHLYDRFGKPEYFTNALDAYRSLTHRFPDSNLADDAQFLIGVLYAEKDPMQAYLEFVKVTTFYPQSDMAARAGERARGLEKQIAARPVAASSDANVSRPARLEQVQYWSAQDYTRVVLYLSSPVQYQQHALPPDKENKQPARIYLDLENCRVSSELDHQFDIMDGFLRDVRIGQFQPEQARAVLDIDSIETHHIFTLADPFRIVIDVRGKRSGKALLQNGSCPPNRLPSLAQQLGLGVHRIVLDPGHGGNDTGAIGPSGTYEKDITLALAKELKRLLEKETACEVILTRSDDRFISLEERTAIANTHKADLFISIHTNAHEDRSVHGTETYFLNLSTDRESARVAAFENATSAKKISDLEAILKDLLRNTKINESSRLAKDVHRRMVGTVSKRYKGMRNLGVKQAPFYVLLGAEMPSILIETAFISNAREERLLKQFKFRKEIAKGIAGGVEEYVKTMKQTAQLGDAS